MNRQFSLTRYFSITSLLLIAIVTAVLAIAYKQHAKQSLIQDQEKVNRLLVQSIANSFWPYFGSYIESVSNIDGDTLRKRPETLKIHKLLRKITANLPILKIKIYNLDGLTIFSSQARQIGQIKSKNKGFFGAARNNKVSSNLTYRNSFTAFSGEFVNRDIIESYVPINNVSGSTNSVFEIYTDVTIALAIIKNRTNIISIGILLTLISLYGILLVIVSRGDRIIKTQYKSLHESEERFRTAITSLQEGFALYDTDDRLVICNDEFIHQNSQSKDIIKPGMQYEAMLRNDIAKGSNVDAVGREEDYICERLKNIKILPRTRFSGGGSTAPFAL